MSTRPANRGDHATYARLFPELAVDDEVFDEERFVSEMMPTTVVADDEGYAYFLVIGDTTHVSQIVVAPNARRRGIGRALLDAVAARAREAGCTTWRLNVKPDNEPALALYESFGMRRMFESCALRLEWRLVPPGPSEGRPIEPEEDAQIEAAMDMLPGQLAFARSANRFPVAIEGGAGVFVPHFPGASVFRVTRPGRAVALLRAMRQHALHDFLYLKIENQPEVAAALLELGATLRLRMIHMAGPLPQASSPP